jgi:serine/threonine protein kinase
MPLAPGTRLGTCQILAPLGSGGMGEVYRARDPRLEREVAIKTVREPGAPDEAHARLWREARAAASVNHPGICQIYDVGEFDGRIFLVMELLSGESLERRLADGPLPLAEALATTLAILDSLEALHRRGIVHRDLKPSNVFMTEGHVKLLDFGSRGRLDGSTAGIPPSPGRASSSERRATWRRNSGPARRSTRGPTCSRRPFSCSRC